MRTVPGKLKLPSIILLLLFPVLLMAQDNENKDTTITGLPVVAAGAPNVVIKKLQALYPQGYDWDYAYGKGEPIEHNLPDDYFKGRTYYNFSFILGDTGINIYLDSAGNTMLTEKATDEEKSPMLHNMRSFLDDNFYHYKIEYSSFKDYSSVDNEWWYNLYMLFAENKREGVLYFDHFGNFTNADFPELPGYIGIKFEQMYPDAEDIIWDRDTLAGKRDYMIHFAQGDNIYHVYCDSTGHNWSNPLSSGAKVPLNILDKFDSLFPGNTGNWFRGDMGELLTLSAKPLRNYVVEFNDVNDTITKRGSWMVFDTLGHILQISHSVSYDSLPGQGKDYIKEHYSTYTIVGTDIQTSPDGTKTYMVSALDPKCLQGDCGYYLYFDIKGRYLKKVRMKTVAEN